MLLTLSLLERSGDSRLWQAYLEGLKKFLAFRESMGMPAAWPIPVEQIRGFLAVESNNSSSKSLSYIAALSYLSKLTGNSDPLEDPVTCFMVTGLKRRAGILRDKYLPITIEMLRSLLGALESVCITHYECLLFRALFTVAFFGALRIGEMVAKHRNVLQPELLYRSDLQLMERKVLLFLPYSLVGQERHVISLALSGEPWVCPVLALRSYLAVRPRLEGPLFVHSDSRTVTKREFLAVLRCALRMLGLCPEQYGVHSFWLGTAVTAARCGYPGEDVTRLARWPYTDGQNELGRIINGTDGLKACDGTVSADFPVEGLKTLNGFYAKGADASGWYSLHWDPPVTGPGSGRSCRERRWQNGPKYIRKDGLDRGEEEVHKFHRTGSEHVIAEYKCSKTKPAKEL
ncbi:hypothetical protein IHE44_0012977 [Lamprotornis superbus]|uniref:Tyr recombinase domain-containing protein n=1 Tax=Lamprotornis superbus TaxID=245042 RepID=A0A835TXN8_9PASS|nr:hypothetical protein IHE44_0012977 [Lamprotornis superbus]